MEPETLAAIFVVAGVVLSALELIAPGLVLLPFGLGAFIAAIAGFFGAAPLTQLVIFLVASALFFLALRPISRRLNRGEPNDGIGSRRLIGTEGVVLEDIHTGDTGMVRIDREEWRAESADGSNMPVGLKIKVVDVRGTRVLVETINSGQIGSHGGPDQ
ncbi:MAG: NfeD family protein [Microthrixaceae bacterium]